MTVEVWKSVVGLEGYYQVSNLGRVRSVDRAVPDKRWGQQQRKGKMMVQTIDKYGYLKVSLTRNNRFVTGNTVHRLVAIAFIPNPENKPQVNHIDGNKTNNNVDNLEWNTNQENISHSVLTGLRKQSGCDNTQAKITPELALQARELRKLGYAYKRIGQSIGVCESHARRIVLGECWKHSNEE